MRARSYGVGLVFGAMTFFSQLVFDQLISCLPFCRFAVCSSRLSWLAFGSRIRFRLLQNCAYNAWAKELKPIHCGIDSIWCDWIVFWHCCKWMTMDVSARDTRNWSKDSQVFSCSAHLLQLRHEAMECPCRRASQACWCRPPESFHHILKAVHKLNCRMIQLFRVWPHHKKIAEL